MQVVSIAECSEHFVLSIFEWLFYTGFTIFAKVWIALENVFCISSPEPEARSELLWSLDVSCVLGIVCCDSSMIASKDIPS